MLYKAIFKVLFFYVATYWCFVENALGESTIKPTSKKIVYNNCSNKSQNKRRVVATITDEEKAYISYTIRRQKVARKLDEKNGNMQDVASTRIMAQPNITFSPDIKSVDVKSSIKFGSDIRAVTKDSSALMSGKKEEHFDVNKIADDLVKNESKEAKIKYSKKQAKARKKEIIPKKSSFDMRAENQSKFYFSLTLGFLPYGRAGATGMQNPAPQTTNTNTPTSSSVPIYETTTTYLPSAEIMMGLGKSFPMPGNLEWMRFWRIEFNLGLKWLNASNSTPTWDTKTFGSSDSTTSIPGNPNPFPKGFGSSLLWVIGGSAYIDFFNVPLGKTVSMYPFIGGGIYFNINQPLNSYISVSPSGPMFDVMAGVMITTFNRTFAFGITYRCTLIYPTTYSVTGYQPGAPSGFIPNPTADYALSYGLTVLQQVEFTLYFF